MTHSNSPPSCLSVLRARTTLWLPALATVLLVGSGCNEPQGGVKNPASLGESSGASSDPGAATSTQGTGSATDVGKAPGFNECASAPNGTSCNGGAGVCNAGACVQPRCGDGIKGPSEQCDDGNTQNGDGCAADCRLESQCGNGVQEAGEGCDAGANNGVSGSGCSAQCQPVKAVCGNGRLEAGEQCDDGNRVGRDGCSSLCTHERCGNQIVDALEQCDDGNLLSGDGCSAWCTQERCGDGVLQVGLGEQCDDGNNEDGDSCNASCKLETVCGNRKVESPYETCDDGNQIDGDGCSADCKLEAGYCGDGIAQASETCDDGNLVDGDGCSKLCQLEDSEDPPCTSIEAQKLPARAQVVAKAPPPSQFVATASVFRRFRDLCGGCHVDAAVDGFQIKAGKMESVAAQFRGWEKQILNDMYKEPSQPSTKDLNIMPVGAKPISALSESAPTAVLASQLSAWFDQGLSPDGFYWEGTPPPPHAGYQVDQKLSGKLTKIGSCKPTKELLHRNQRHSQRMDAFFAKADHLPELLSDTDFISMDSKELAKAGVISYATTYELWADNAKKMRHFKLPYGKKIRFDRKKQLFILPENTRVYKTFLKAVKDKDGNIGYRKMETRVILVRQDEIGEDGAAKVRALYGSYKWSDDETQARLSDIPLRNEKPFADDIFTYIVDEAKAKEIKNSGTKSVAQDMIEAGASRHYVIPGSQRCEECHLGSLEQNFVVGFSPLQLNRRRTGAGGVLDEVSSDELNQLQHFIDLGLFENFDNLSDVRLLEAEQSPSVWSGRDAISPDQAKENRRFNEENPNAKPKPAHPRASSARGYRNQAELEMQGYMVGNCAHCHNPRGFPSVREPALAERLNFHPLAEAGGIFEFRMDNMSPRNERAGDKRISVPYISPSLYDVYEPDQTGTSTFKGTNGFDLGEPAPWRSLIYRNVDTPYTYVFHRTVYPHMPVHTPGYDCRIRDLAAKWMLSIPARITDPASKKSKTHDPELFPRGATMNPQPWEEVYPGDAEFADASGAAKLRVEKYLKGGQSSAACRGEFGGKINIEAQNIISPIVLSGARTEPWINPFGLITEAHFGPYDMTNPPPPWIPRRSDWDTALIRGEVADDAEGKNGEGTSTGTGGSGAKGGSSGKGQADESGSTSASKTKKPKKRALLTDEAALIKKILPSLRLDDTIRSMALEPIPLGFWEAKKECSFTDDKTISDLPENERWEWMKGVSDKKNQRPLYYEAPGATIFKAVCAQCHGRKGDTQGLMTNLLNELTGGESRVADFKSGMFGPSDKFGFYLASQFGEAAGSLGISVDDMAARYMTWMSLGGTRSRIHSGVLNLVNGTRILGEARPAVRAAKDANMLNVAKDICGAMINRVGAKAIQNALTSKRFPVLSPLDPHKQATFPLIGTLADAEMWFRICTYNNPMPIMIVGPVAGSTSVVPQWMSGDKLSYKGPYMLLGTRAGFVRRYQRGSNKALWNGSPMLVHDGLGKNARVEPLSDSTVFPVCLRRPPSEHIATVNDRLAKENALVNGKPMPYCPESWEKWNLDGWNLFEYSFDSKDPNKDYPHMMTEEDIQEWVMRGAANAGLMVYAFTKELLSGRASLQTDYNRCEERSKPGDTPKESEDKPKGEKSDKKDDGATSAGE